MQYSFPADVQQLLEREMHEGGYGSEDDALRDALRALAERRSDLAAIAGGITDLEAGRTRPFSDVSRELAAKHRFTDS